MTLPLNQRYHLTIIATFLFLHIASLFTMASALSVTAVNVQFVVKPEQREAFLKHLKDDADQTLATEEGNLQFVVGEDIDAPNTFHLHEQYKTDSDYEYHQTTKHFKAFAQFLQGDESPLAEEPVIVAYKCQHHGATTKIAPRPAFCLNVESCIKPEFREEFVALMKSHQQNSLAEPLCMQFDYGVSLDDPDVFHQHEEFTGNEQGKEGYEAHQKGAHFDRFMEFNKKDPYIKPQAVRLFKTIFV